MTNAAGSSKGRRGTLAMAGALIAGVALAAWQVRLIPEPPVAADVGPQTMPAALVVLLGVLALAYLYQALTGRASDATHDPDESPLPGRHARFLYLVAGLAAMLLLTPLAGIGPACVAAFVLVARAFDSRRLLRDLLVACVFVFVIWYVFDRLLGVQLGPFTSLIPRF